ncbi:divalent-cation tolerance protein CutA [Pararhodospirillum photometricum]|nr:divalent-cation tolerance protein CutA [Pararhodospirillum photometricum]
MTQCRLVYMTAASEEEARRLGAVLVGERLAACVNVLGPMRSIYTWDGVVRDEPEVAFLAKTTEAKVPALQARILELHSYDCPCVVVLPIVDGAPAFLDWVAASV